MAKSIPSSGAGAVRIILKKEERGEKPGMKIQNKKIILCSVY